MANTGGFMRKDEPQNSGPLFHTSGLLNRKRKNGKRASTAKLINAHYIEIDYLLERVEASKTHYQVLGVDREAKSEKIILAYQKSVAALHHPYYKVRAAVPDELLERIDSAFRKISEAFSVLTHHGLRGEYDRSLNRRPVSPLPLEDSRRAEFGPTTKAAPPEIEQSQKPAGAQMAASTVSTSERPVFWKAAGSTTGANRRRCERFKLSVPALVAGYERGGKWQEVTKTIDVSRMGVAIRMKRRVREGAVVHITLPLPTRLRSHGFSDPGYNMYAIVRRVEPAIDGMRVVGLEFLGKRPPTGYLHKPWNSFRTEQWKGPDRRREPRFEASEQVVVEYLDQSMQMVGREIALTENVSLNGARLIARNIPDDFEWVRVTSARRSFHSLAAVRNRYVGKDNSERLCLQFMENKWPIKN